MDRTLLLASLDSTGDLSKGHVKTALTTMKDVQSQKDSTKIMRPVIVTLITVTIATLIYLFATGEARHFFSKSEPTIFQDSLARCGNIDFSYNDFQTAALLSVKGMVS